MSSSKPRTFIQVHSRAIREFKKQPGNSVPRCYFTRIGGCKGSLSREHLISHSILKRMGPIKCEGIPWLKHKVGSIPPKALVVRCLCEGHNTALSAIDTGADKAFGAIERLWSEKKISVHLSSKIFELWMLKILCGLLASKKMEFQGKTHSAGSIKLEWLEYLAGWKPLPPGQGIYLYYRLGGQIVPNKKVIAGIQYLNGNPGGLSLDFHGVVLMLSLEEPGEAFKIPPEHAGVLYRDFKIKLEDQNSILAFKWNY